MMRLWWAPLERWCNYNAGLACQNEIIKTRTSMTCNLGEPYHLKELFSQEASPKENNLINMGTR